MLISVEILELAKLRDYACMYLLGPENMSVSNHCLGSGQAAGHLFAN